MHGSFTRRPNGVSSSTKKCLTLLVTDVFFPSPPPDHLQHLAIEPQTAIEGDDATLTCRGTRYLYTDLQWKDPQNYTITNNVTALQFSPYSISLSLSLHNVSRNHTAGYQCWAHKIHNKRAIVKIVLTVHGEEVTERTLPAGCSMRSLTEQ